MVRSPASFGPCLLLTKIVSSRLPRPLALRPFKSLDHVRREGIAGFNLLVAAILLGQVGFDFFGMLQNERDGAVDLRQRTEGGVGVKDRLGGPPVPKVVGN